MMKRATVLVALLLTLLAFAWTAQAQTGGGYDLSWSTAEGGGGVSTGGGFALGGSIGQADASTELTGGNYALVGGFWEIKVQNPTAVGLAYLAARSDKPPWAALAALVLAAAGLAAWPWRIHPSRRLLGQ